MTREIKFRGRSTHSDDWCYGSFVNNPDEPTICGFDIWADGNSDWREEKVEPHTVGQYTGLCDSNGKEIYEGDIIRTYGSKGDEIKHTVYYSDKEAMFCTKLIGADMLGGGITQRWLDEFEFEVIGNVHDDPELLKGGEK